jgi:hypothetical protein
MGVETFYAGMYSLDVLWNLYDFFTRGRSLMQPAWLVELTEAVRSKSYVLNRFNYWKTLSDK